MNALNSIHWTRFYHFAARTVCGVSALLCLIHLQRYAELYQWGALPSAGQAFISVMLCLVSFIATDAALFLVACFAVLTALSF